MKRGRTEW